MFATPWEGELALGSQPQQQVYGGREGRIRATQGGPQAVASMAASNLSRVRQSNSDFLILLAK